jgi:hypothetical protein
LKLVYGPPRSCGPLLVLSLWGERLRAAAIQGIGFPPIKLGHYPRMQTHL